jgi:hypothetical protein
MPSDTLLTEEKKKAEYIGRQLRISLFAAAGTPHPALRARNGNVFAAWLQLFSFLQFPMDRLDFSGLSLRTFLILNSSLPPFVYCFACGKNCCSCAQPFAMFSPCIVNDLQIVIVQTESVSLLCISLLISSYMFQLNCRHQGAETILLKLTAVK